MRFPSLGLRPTNTVDPAALSVSLPLGGGLYLALDVIQGRMAYATLRGSDAAGRRDTVLVSAEAPLPRCRIDDRHGALWCGTVRFQVPMRDLHRVHGWLQAARETS